MYKATVKPTFTFQHHHVYISSDTITITRDTDSHFTNFHCRKNVEFSEYTRRVHAAVCKSGFVRMYSGGTELKLYEVCEFIRIKLSEWRGQYG